MEYCTGAKRNTLCFREYGIYFQLYPRLCKSPAGTGRLFAEVAGDIDAVYAEIAEMQSRYNADKVFLTPSMREDREKEIAAKENKARLLQQQYFGTDGYLFAKREELVKPLQDEVLAVIKDVAKEGNFGMIIDVAADNSVVYFDPKLDKSNVVLRKLGYSVKKKEE